MSNFLANFVRDESGAAAAEYVLILAIVGGGVAAGAYLLGTNISQALTAKANLVSTCSNNPSATTCK
jgi:pilus assembly protein Flp/PilA